MVLLNQALHVLVLLGLYVVTYKYYELPACCTSETTFHEFVKPIKHCRYLKIRINYYSNSSATFNDQILRAGDIDPNPGPNHNQTFSPNDPISVAHKYTRDQLFDIGNAYKTTPLAPNVWSRIVTLGINNRHL